MSLPTRRRSTVDAVDDAQLMAELEPTAIQLYERHMSTAKEWFPHELVPWSRGRDSSPTRPGSPSESPMLCGGAAARCSSTCSPRTTCPYYYRQLDARSATTTCGASGTRRWTAEEGRHSIVIRDYLDGHPRRSTRSRSSGPACTRCRRGQVPDPPTRSPTARLRRAAGARDPHRRTATPASCSTTRPGTAIMSRVAADENLHHLFYRDLVPAALELDPSAMVVAIERQVRKFEMPGTGIPDFDRTRARSPTPASTTSRSTTTRSSCRSCSRHWRIEQLQNLKSAASRRARAPGEARREGRQRRQAHEARAWRRVPRRPESNAAAFNSSGRARGARGSLELVEPAVDDAVVRPRERGSGHPRQRTEQGRPDVEGPRQPRLGSVRGGCQLETCGAFEVSWSHGSRASGVARPRRRGSCTAAGTAGAPGSRDARWSRPGKPSPSTRNSRSQGHQSRVLVGLFQRGPQLVGRDREAPGPVEVERRGHGRAPCPGPRQHRGRRLVGRRACVRGALETAEREHERRRPHRRRARDVDADEERRNVAEVLRVAHAGLGHEHHQQHGEGRFCTLAGARSRRMSHRVASTSVRNSMTRVPCTRAALSTLMPSRGTLSCCPPPLCGPAPVTTVPLTRIAAAGHEQHPAHRHDAGAHDGPRLGGVIGLAGVDRTRSRRTAARSTGGSAP